MPVKEEFEQNLIASRRDSEVNIPFLCVTYRV